MKKQLLTLGLILAAGISVAQDCNVDIAALNTKLANENKTWGAMPDTTQNLPTGAVNVLYDNTLGFKLPTKANELDPNQPAVTLNTIELISVSGLPPGMTFTSPTSQTDNLKCDGQSSTAQSQCKWAGGSYGCVRLVGTPTQIGTFPLNIILQGNTAVGSGQGPLNGYRIVVTPTGVELISDSEFKVTQNVPNPFNGITKIEYTLSKNLKVDFSVINLLGETVYSNVYSGAEGKNTINFDGSNLKQGIYMYTLQIGAQKITKRMVVNK